MSTSYTLSSRMEICNVPQKENSVSSKVYLSLSFPDVENEFTVTK